jgi:hypothetical protein
VINFTGGARTIQRVKIVYRKPLLFVGPNPHVEVSGYR